MIRHSIGLTCAALALTSITPLGAAQQYNAAELGGYYFHEREREWFGYAEHGVGISETALICGYSSETERGFAWVTDFLNLGQDGGRLNDVNEGGLFVGEIDREPAIFDTDRWTRLGTFGGPNGEATAINRRGVVVGFAEDGQGRSRAFRFDGDAIIDIGDLGGLEAQAHGISDGGRITGWARNSAGDARAMLCQNGVMIDIGTLGGRSSWAFGMSDSDHVVGQSETPSGDIHAFLFDGDMNGGQLIDLGVLDGDERSIAYDVNNHGQAVGTSLFGSEGPRAFVWQDGAMHDLNDLARPSVWTRLNVARSINDAGVIVGTGTLNGLDRAFVLIPSDLEMNQPTPGVAGIENEIAVSGATPTSMIHLFFSLRGGFSYPASCPGMILQLRSPVLVGTAPANMDGIATFHFFVPYIASHRIILFQALESGRCTASNLLRTTFE